MGFGGWLKDNWNPLEWGEGQKVDIDPEAGRLPGADGMRERVRGYEHVVSSRTAPLAERTTVGPMRTGTAARMDPTQQAQFRAREMALADRLSGIMGGTQQGAGELAVQRQGNRAIAQQQAFARMGRGAGAASASRTAARTSGDIALNTAGQAQQAALQDQQMAAGQLGGVLAQGRAADLSVASQNAQLAQQMNLANLSAQNQAIVQQAGLDQATSLADQAARLQTMGMNDQARLALMAQMYNVNVAEMQGLLAREGLKVDNFQPAWGPQLLNVGGQGAVAYASRGGGGGAAAAAPAAAAASDRRAKKKVVGAKDVDKMLERLKPYEYEYREPDKPLRGRGRHVSVMAQDLERSKLGKEMVSEDREGTKVVDYGKGLGTMLAAISRVHERVAAIEKGK